MHASMFNKNMRNQHFKKVIRKVMTQSKSEMIVEKKRKTDGYLIQNLKAVALVLKS